MKTLFISILAALVPGITFAQASPVSLPPSALSVEEAVAVALRNNPDRLALVNNRQSADAAVKAARGQLLPNADASFFAQRQQGGRQIFGGTSLGASSDINQSQYQIGIGYRLNRATLITPKLQRANREAVEADITGNAQRLRSDVIQQYVAVLQAEATAGLQDTLLAAAATQIVLAKARALVGSGSQLDVSRAEVTLGQQQVQALRAIDQISVEKLRLYLLLGQEMPDNVTLTTDFTTFVEPPPYADLVALARESNRVLDSYRYRAKAADINVKRAKSEYTPTLSINTGISGYTYSYANSGFLVNQAVAQATASQAACIRNEEVRSALGLPNTLGQCQSIGLTDAQAGQIRSDNRQFPFGFQTSPRSISATISVPLFDGFAREQRVQEAQLSQADAQIRLKQAELGMITDIKGAYLSLDIARKTAVIQTQNSAKARLELKFTQDRYRTGAVSLVDVTDARVAYERAESDRIRAVYEYHRAFAQLEGSVGRPLR